MRKSLQRALTLAMAAPVAAVSLVVAAPAASAAIPSCPAGEEVAFELINGDYRVAAYTPSGTVTVLCLQAADTLQAVVKVDAGLGLTPPGVTPVPGEGNCDTVIFNLTNPSGYVSLYAGISQNGPSICLSNNGESTTLQFSAPGLTSLPGVEVWLPAGSDTLYYWCYANYYPLYLATQDSRYEDLRSACRYTDLRLV